MSTRLPGIEDVHRAAQTLSGFAVRTPLIENTRLNELTGVNLFIKPENLQKTGSFKFRGAYNALANLEDDVRSKGVAASSSGNHAQGVSRAASLFGVQATIVMPSDAPEVKIAGTRKDGANIVHYNRATEDREAVLRKVLEEEGLELVHPYNNTMVIAGQGTVGLEIVEDMEKAGKNVDRVLVCTGGGGLTAGVAIAVHNSFPDAKVHTVEPEGFDDYRRSLDTGAVVRNEKTSGSLCDALLAPAPGELGFEVNRNVLSEGLVVSDTDAMEAVQLAFRELKMVVEPGGAVALAAAVKYGNSWAGENVVVIISGGNVDPETFNQAIKPTG